MLFLAGVLPRIWAAQATIKWDQSVKRDEAECKMGGYGYEFPASVELLDFGSMAYSVVYAPNDIVQKLKLEESPRLRVCGDIGGKEFAGASQPAGAGQYYLILSKKFCRDAQLSVGDRTSIRIDVADQNAVDVPRELQFALNAREEAHRVWQSLTPGRRRGFAHRVGSAKRASTIENRVEEVIEALLEIPRNRSS
ncbi:MAG: YdeI/OmpD-associated family protein [Aureliella sp.]